MCLKKRDSERGRETEKQIVCERERERGRDRQTNRERE